MYASVWLIVVILLPTIIIPACSIAPIMTMINATNISKPGCPRKCGNLTVPYPFGVGLGAGCSRSLWYDVFCMTSVNPAKAFLPTTYEGYKGNKMEILDISETHIRLRNHISYKCFNSTAETSPELVDFSEFSLITPRAPFTVSDINECTDLIISPCSMRCTNTPGNYTCSCPYGYAGDGRKDGTGCKRQFPVMEVGLGIGFSSLFMLIVGSWLCLARRKSRLKKMRENFFEQNGGLLLKQLVNPNKQDSDMEQIKVFTIEELKSATNNFKDERVVGRGGYGTVYKGVLSNNDIVAIKRSKFVDESQIEQFINELIILARTRHPSVVRLLGCCLEVEVPLLVYEFIPNGTLYDHIHNSKDGSSWYSWKNSLRIAMDSANALQYLHSIPIFHRDIKSSNILVSDSYKAKIADFGASRLIPLNNTHLSTIVQGTLGYLDPEYFFSSQLTEKSDVYSFGVVLAELLTRKRAILPESLTDEEQNQNLAACFVKSLQQDNLYNILDSQLIMEATQEQLTSIAMLVQRCLNVKGDERPTMKEVAIELEDLWKETMQLSNSESLDADLYEVEQ